MSLEQDVSGRCFPKNMVQVPPVTDDSKNGIKEVFQKIWIKLLKIYDKKIGINWTWQSIDSISIKSPLGGAMTAGNNPTDRGKLGTKIHILTDKEDIPLSAAVSSASTHDINLVTEVVDNAVVRTRRGRGRGRGRDRRQHLCLDKGYNSERENRNYSDGVMYCTYQSRRKRKERIVKKK